MPMFGGEGVTGWAFIVALSETLEEHPDASVTIKLYTPGERLLIVVVVPVPEVVIPPA